MLLLSSNYANNIALQFLSLLESHNRILFQLYEDEETEEPDIFLSKIDNENEYSEYDIYDQNSKESTTEMNDTVDTNTESYRSAADLTKDVKDEIVTRNKRNVIGATDDGVLVNAESYAEKKRRNHTAMYSKDGISITSVPAQPSSFGYGHSIKNQKCYISH